MHIAGTNGKGSSSHTLAAILQSQGYKVGLFTSPHLVDFKDIIGIEKYSSVFYGAKVDGAVDRNNSEGRGGAIPSLGEIRNCHINVGTGKELTIRELSELVVKAVGFEGEVEFDASKPDGTMRKLISVDKLHSLGWTHKVEIEDGVKKLFDWYQESLKD